MTVLIKRMEKLLEISCKYPASVLSRRQNKMYFLKADVEIRGVISSEFISVIKVYALTLKCSKHRVPASSRKASTLIDTRRRGVVVVPDRQTTVPLGAFSVLSAASDRRKATTKLAQRNPENH